MSVFRRMITALLVLVMLMGIIPGAAFAEEVILTSNVEYEVVEMEELSFLSTTGNYNPPLKCDNAVQWIDRLDAMPQYALELYSWMEENSDNDGQSDAMIDVSHADFDGYGLLHKVTTFTGSAPFEVPDGSAEEIISQAGKAAIKDETDMLKAKSRAMMVAVDNAFDRDHPEVFWMGKGSQTVSSMSTRISRDSDGWVITYELTMYYALQLQNFDIRAEKYKDVAVLRSAIAQRDNMVDVILSGMPNESTMYEKVQYFNKWLTKNNCYNTSSNLNNIDSDCRSCMSALVGKTGTEGPVCEGYARAMKVLCDEVSIPCVLVDGDSEGEPHMWNYVQQDDRKWYAVDTTWNDPSVSGVTGKVSGYENEDYLLVGGDTVIDGKTFLQTHVVENKVSESGPAFINGPMLASQAYVPGTAPVPSEPTTEPTTAPTTEPTTAPTTEPTTAPTTEPTTAPTTEPTTAPTTEPTTAPTTAPTEPAEDILERLREIVEAKDSMTVAEICAAVQALDSQELAEKMYLGLTSLGVEMKIDGANSDFGKLSATVGESKSAVLNVEHPALNEEFRIGMMGLSLNNYVSDDVPAILTVSSSENTIPVPVGYNPERILRFSVSMENIQNPESLKVPVVLGLPAQEDPESGIHPYFQGVFWKDAVTGEIKEVPVFVEWSMTGMVFYTTITGSGEYLIAQKKDGFVSGSCGDNMTWRYDDTNTLTISGSGNMYDYCDSTEKGNLPPWAYYKDMISYLTIEDGVNGVGNHAFDGCRIQGTYSDHNMSVLHIPASVTHIGEEAFVGQYMTFMIFHGDAPVFEENSLGYLKCIACYPEGNNTWTEIIKHKYGAQGGEDWGFCWKPLGTSGSCGENVFWSFDETSGTLTISGTGEMAGYPDVWDSFRFGAPWIAYYPQIKKVVIENGVTNIGAYAFYNCYLMTEVQIAETVERIDSSAFAQCSNLLQVELPNGLKSLGSWVFFYCGVRNIVIPESVTNIESGAFVRVEIGPEPEMNTVWESIRFCGDMPIFGEDCFKYVQTTVYYPANNPTWTEGGRQNYGGNITWVPYEDSTPPEPTTEPTTEPTEPEPQLPSIAGKWQTDVVFPAAEMGVSAPDSVLRATMTFGEDGQASVTWEAIDLTAIKEYFHQMFVNAYYACAYGAGVTSLEDIERMCMESSGMSVSDYMYAFMEPYDMKAMFTPASTSGRYIYNEDHSAIYTDMPIMEAASDAAIANVFRVTGDHMTLNAASYGKPEYTFACVRVGTVPDATVPEQENDPYKTMEQKVIELVNNLRVGFGLSVLEYDEDLGNLARLKSEDMVQNNYFDHISPTYGSPGEMLRQFHVSYGCVGENIAQGFVTPEEVVSAWMGSDGHRANILDPDFTHIGVGYESTRHIWTQLFVGR